MGESRAGRRPVSPHSGASRSRSTVKEAGDDHVTLRLGSAQHAHGALPAWRTRYEDLGELARGGLSSIRVVFDRLIRRRVAMKVHDGEADPSGLADFLEEARITGQLDHPNIVPVHDVQYDERGLPTRFTMKLVEGETLADAIERATLWPLPGEELERLLRIFLKICDAVSFAHSRRVIHCDLKPSNVMVGSHGQVYVTDWGVALRRAPPPIIPHGDEGDRPSEHGLLSGTPAFMAPEQTLGRPSLIDERTDVYGLGTVLYAILTGGPPRDGGSSAADLELARSGVVRAPHEVVKGRPLPPGLCAIALRALEADPDRRHESVEALKHEVEAFMRGGGWFETTRRPAGSSIISEGATPDAAYILIEGQCELFHHVAGVKRSIRTLGPGDVFGEISIFGSVRRTASVVAATDVHLVRVTRSALERELERAGWLKTFVDALAQRFLEVDAELRDLELATGAKPNR